MSVFARVDQVTSAKPVLKVVQEEVGEIEEASADLDDRIANLLKTD